MWTYTCPAVTKKEISGQCWSGRIDHDSGALIAVADKVATFAGRRHCEENTRVFLFSSLLWRVLLCVAFALASLKPSSPLSSFICVSVAWNPHHSYGFASPAWCSCGQRTGNSLTLSLSLTLSCLELFPAEVYTRQFWWTSYVWCLGWGELQIFGMAQQEMEYRVDLFNKWAAHTLHPSLCPTLGLWVFF
jgi:hypothetical protein